jgi:hypothetical protein
MLRMSVLSVTIASMLGLGWVTRAIASPWRRVVMQKRFEKPERVDLAGLATIELPPSFKPAGRGQDGYRRGNFSPETLDQHRDDYQITFRFEQGQHHVLGGYLADPVLLHVTLFNPAMPKPDATKITFTTISKFYPPVDNDRPRLDAHFVAQRWLPEIVTGDAITRSAATGEGRGDDLVSGPPLRWLVIHVDPTRRIRVDFFAWRKMYSIDEAQALVHAIAQSVQTTPKLAAMFDAVKNVEAREEAELEQAVSGALAQLGQCGIRSLGPEMVAWSDRCAAWQSDDRRFLRLARPIGRLPLALAKGRVRGVPDFRFDVPAGRPTELSGETDFRLAMLFWDDATGDWKVAGVDHTHDEWKHVDGPLVSAILPRLKDRTSVHLIALTSYDLKFHPERVVLERFLTEADRVAGALREGRIVAGVRGAAFAFER